MPWDGAYCIGKGGVVIGVARKLNATESPLKLKGNFGTKHNSCVAFAYQHKCVVTVRSDDEHLKGISVFSHSALKLNPPQAYHIVLSGQENSAASELMCAVCGLRCASRNKLFEHIKSSGHARARQARA